jgi:hypothetical protein
MTQYVGLCVGGPMAGENIARPTQKFSVFEKPYSKSEVETSYGWHHLGPFAIWIHETMDHPRALEAMALAYAEKHNGRR